MCIFLIEVFTRVEICSVAEQSFNCFNYINCRCMYVLQNCQWISKVCSISSCEMFVSQCTIEKVRNGIFAFSIRSFKKVLLFSGGGCQVYFTKLLRSTKMFTSNEFLAVLSGERSVRFFRKKCSREIRYRPKMRN
jgi:hypothetical protein